MDKMNGDTKHARNLPDANARSTHSRSCRLTLGDRLRRLRRSYQSINTMRLCAVEYIRKSLDGGRSRVDVSMRSVTMGERQVKSGHGIHMLCMQQYVTSAWYYGYNNYIQYLPLFGGHRTDVVHSEPFLTCVTVRLVRLTPILQPIRPRDPVAGNMGPRERDACTRSQAMSYKKQCF